MLCLLENKKRTFFRKSLAFSELLCYTPNIEHLFKMEREIIMEALLVLFCAGYGSGLFFFRVLRYIEGHPVGSRMFRLLAAFPLSIFFTLFTRFLMRGASGYAAHPIAEAICSLIFAALFASVASAAALLFFQHKKCPQQIAAGRKPARVAQRRNQQPLLSQKNSRISSSGPLTNAMRTGIGLSA